MNELPPGQIPAPAGGMPYALWADRVLAALIDYAIVLVLAMLLIGVLFLISLIFAGLAAAANDASRTGESSPLGLMPCCLCCGAPLGVAVVGFLFGLFNKVYLVGKRGYSIGQGFRRLRVVLPNGQRVPYGTLLLRLLVQFGLGLIWVVQLLDLLWPLWDEKRQTLHDKAVGTFVIEAR
jgi:uncharacterized RDD family membrane protein YckC